MRNDGTKTHFHDGYPTRGTGDRMYIDKFLPGFKSLASSLKQKGITVLNASTYSRLNVFTKISLDAALLALKLYKSGYKTFNIAVGNNLMEESWASDLFRLNKSFIIHRSGGTKKEIYSGLSLASQFIYKSIFQDND